MDKPLHLVLCVDDEVVGLSVRRRLLEHAGYRVLTAADGRTGLELFADHPVDAVILDYAMPQMDGGQVAIQMRQIKPEVPILMLSAFVDLPAEVLALVDLRLTKGEGAAALFEKLGTLIARHRIAPIVEKIAPRSVDTQSTDRRVKQLGD
jgi:CheY-like chemotaxis protein